MDKESREALHAWIDGKEIQVSSDGEHWADWYPTKYKYRLKPKQEREELPGEWDEKYSGEFKKPGMSKDTQWNINDLAYEISRLMEKQSQIIRYLKAKEGRE